MFFRPTLVLALTDVEAVVDGTVDDISFPIARLHSKGLLRDIETLAQRHPHQSRQLLLELAFAILKQHDPLFSASGSEFCFCAFYGQLDAFLDALLGEADNSRVA